MFTRRLLVREEESHLRGKLLFNSKERSLPTSFFNARIWIYIVFQAAEYSHRPPVLLITCNIKGPNLLSEQFPVQFNIRLYTHGEVPCLTWF